MHRLVDRMLLSNGSDVNTSYKKWPQTVQCTHIIYMVAHGSQCCIEKLELCEERVHLAGPDWLCD